MSKYHLSRQFKESMEITIYQYILKRRLSKSKLLISEGMPLTTTCKLCSFKDYSSFFKAFKKEYGISPKTFKERIQY